MSEPLRKALQEIFEEVKYGEYGWDEAFDKIEDLVKDSVSTPAREELREWRGLRRCKTCGLVANPDDEYGDAHVDQYGKNCIGCFEPWERRSSLVGSSDLREALIVASSVLGWIATIKSPDDWPSAIDQARITEISVDAALAGLEQGGEG